MRFAPNMRRAVSGVGTFRGGSIHFFTLGRLSEDPRP